MWIFSIAFGAASIGVTALPIEDKLRACYLAGQLAPGVENSSPAQVNADVAAAQADRRRICALAEKATAEMEEKAGRLAAASAQAGHAMEKTLSDAGNLVTDQLNSFEQTLTWLKQIPNNLSLANNALMEDASQQLADHTARVSNLDSSWDSLFNPKPGGALDVIAKMDGDEDLPEGVRGDLDTYLKRIPPYLLGKSPAPREKIEFLLTQENVLVLAFSNKSLEYTRSVRQEGDGILQQTIGPRALRDRATAVRTKLRKRFGYKTPVWAEEAVRAGACNSAVEEMAQQSSAMTIAVSLVLPVLKELLQTTLAKDIHARQAFLDRTRCSPAGDSLQLVSSLARAETELPTNCSSAPADVKEDIVGLTAEMSAARDLMSQSGIPIARRQALLVIGQELWNRGYNYQRTCLRGGK